MSGVALRQAERELFIAGSRAHRAGPVSQTAAPIRMSVSGLAPGLLAASLLLCPEKPAFANEATFRSPAECVHVLKLEPDHCAWIMENAWRRFQDFGPQYSSRKECWRSNEVCIAVQVHRVLRDARKGPIQPFAAYGPPLWAIRIRLDAPHEPPEVLIDRAMRPLADESRIPIPSAGFFLPTAEVIRSQYLKAYESPEPRGKPDRNRAPRPGRAPGDEGVNSLAPVASYPVAPSRLRSMRQGPPAR